MTADQRCDVRVGKPTSQLMFHLGYEHDDNDRHDVMLLCDKYGFDVPEQYRQ